MRVDVPHPPAWMRACPCAFSASELCSAKARLHRQQTCVCHDYSSLQAFAFIPKPSGLQKGMHAAMQYVRATYRQHLQLASRQAGMLACRKL